MKYLLSIIAVLALLCGHATAAVVGSPRVIEISPDAPAGSAATLTNVFKNLQNNTTYRLLPGTNRVNTWQSHVAFPMLTIANKSNITVEGLGWHSVVHTPQTGTVFKVYNSYNITFRNMAITGTLAPPGLELTSQFALIELDSTFPNGNITVDNVRLANCSDHGITSLGERTATNCIVRDCLFEDIGSTNNGFGGIASDGTGVVILGDNMKVINNTFLRCFNGVEWERSGASAYPVRNTIVTGNQFEEMTGYAIYAQGATNPDLWTDFNISGNTIRYHYSQKWGLHSIGIKLIHGRRGLIADNIIVNASVGILIQPQAGVSFEGWTIRGNRIFCTSAAVTGIYENGGIYMGHNGGGVIFGNTIEGNYIEHTAEAGIQFNGGWTNIVRGNQLNNTATNNVFNGAIRVKGDAVGNLIEGNYIYADADTVPTRYGYGFLIESPANFNTFKDNHIRNYQTAPWTDGGAGNELRNNWVGTNIVPVVPTTNNYTTTNVVINLAGRESQVLDATNSMLLIWTNTGGYAAQSGKRVRVALINNKATNMNVAHTAANLRLFGQHSGTVTNGRTLVFQVEVVGTNYNIEAIQQQN